MTHETRDADADTPSRRHQVGAERSTEPLPVLHSRPSAFRLVLGRLAIVVTVLSWAMYVITTVLRRVIENELTTLGTVIETVVYLGIVTLLSFSALMYLVSRQGAHIRFRSHQRVPRAQVDRHFSVPDPRHGITVLIPSYVEETHVVVKTIWSAALQEFPDLQVVLLIDDPPNPGDPERLRDLETTRRLGETVMSALAAPSSRLTRARDTAGVRLRGVAEVSGAELSRLASEYRWAAHWLEQMAEDWEVVDHTDQFFVHQVLGDLARDLRTTVTALEGASREHGSLPLARVLQLYDRLAWTFTASVRTFERKQYASLSHEANKAMNLNAYISLMGHSWKRVETQRGVILREVYEGEYADLEVPDSEYLLTLDADSMLLREYCLRLVYLLECPENERVAVAQTPYCSYRGAPTRMERIAAATTDIQHILHQGLTYYDATFWVGANAVIRKRALDDIAQVSTEGARTVTTYIQDRTVIEDTESSVDLGLHRWHLVNYPERLSYSATPPDFGSLVVQRRRWANGGLLILPKFIQQMRERRNTSNAVHLTQAALRINYMASIAWASIGLVFLLAFPFDSRLLSPWVIAAAAPYFLCMAQDLRDSRYKRTDVFRIYGFNLILLAVNVAGTLKSVQQGLTNEKIPFARTPKVSNRTAAPWPYVLAPLAIIGLSCVIFVLDWHARNWGNAAFAGFNAVMCTWALVSYIGVRNCLEDLFFGILGWFFVPVEQPRQDGAPRGHSRGTDWRALLYYGELAQPRGGGAAPVDRASAGTWSPPGHGARPDTDRSAGGTHPGAVSSGGVDAA
ncbi:glycosyltransferase family 2 protein [Actinomyces polynesiensis]|uniref:glycosyltransferase family 2 protein n=1 Tax=Actinomyces polynesiensis TaxID=1325934 RepID=UPI00093903D0|nr:glycosyltransferase family 2 protein [Actinomyces polynesiensis]